MPYRVILMVNDIELRSQRATVPAELCRLPFKERWCLQQSSELTLFLMVAEERDNPAVSVWSSQGVTHRDIHLASCRLLT